MPKFLIDANLPFRIKIWRSSDFVHVKEPDESWPDRVIFEYAKENNLIIVTKDADFSARIIQSEPPPKIIHLKIGNLRLHELNAFVENHWSEIAYSIYKCKLLNVYLEKIESIK